MDIFGKCAEYTDARDHMAIGLYPYFLRETIMCGSNNYLGLTSAAPRTWSCPAWHLGLVLASP
jgi:hypothetical protein